MKSQNYQVKGLKLNHFFKIHSYIYIVLFIAMQQLAMATNILVIGSDEDSSSYTKKATPVSAFNSAKVVTELEAILKGSGLKDINVEYVNHNREIAGFRHTNLFSWFKFPYPEGVSEKKRWPNLRGELDVKWDYVVLIGDPHTIEYLPGFYALGVSHIGKEVAKGGAKTVLFMPWPAENSKSSLDHYKEVVYRVGRSAGYAIAPAGLAWAESGEKVGDSHPTDKGAYIAAATIYSRLFNKSASSSNYYKGNKFADLAYKTVKKNKGMTQYTGRFSTPHPHSMQFNPTRHVRHSYTGTSTERGHMKSLAEIMKKCGVEYSNYYSHRYDSNDPKADKGGWHEGIKKPIDFNIGKFGYYSYDEFNINPEYWKYAYTYQYQGTLKSNEMSMAKISKHDMNAGVMAYQNAPYLGATIPRSTWALLHRLAPHLKMNGTGNHLSKIAILPNAAFIYTCESGRCPLTPREENPTDEWNALKIGYESGWIMGNLQARAPGLRVLPSAAHKHEINNFTASGKENMTAQFIFKPEAPVTVKLTSTNPEFVEITPNTLTFTSENYDVPQSYTVSIKDNAPTITEDISVKIATSSKDEVYNNLSDSWLYTVKSIAASELSVATKDSYRTGVNKTLKVGKDKGLLANDQANPLTPVTKISLVDNVANGELSISNDGAFSYTPTKGFIGNDSFTYSLTNTNGRSEAATVNLAVSDLDPSLILWYEFEKENGDSIKDSTLYGRDGTVTKPVKQVTGVADDTFGIDLTRGEIDIPIDQDFYDLLDREISIAFWTNINPVKKAKDNSILLRGSIKYDNITFKSLNIQFQSNTEQNSTTILWENGIYTQYKRVGSYKIISSLKHSKAKIPLTPETVNDQWVHWTFMRSRDTSLFSVYKNGKLAFRGGLADLNSYGLIDEIDTLKLGGSFKGKIDDFRIYNRELSVKEITQIMRGVAPTLTENLIKKTKKKSK